MQSLRINQRLDPLGPVLGLSRRLGDVGDRLSMSSLGIDLLYRNAFKHPLNVRRAPDPVDLGQDPLLKVSRSHPQPHRLPVLLHFESREEMHANWKLNQFGVRTGQLDETRSETSTCRPLPQEKPRLAATQPRSRVLAAQRGSIELIFVFSSKDSISPHLGLFPMRKRSRRHNLQPKELLISRIRNRGIKLHRHLQQPTPNRTFREEDVVEDEEAVVAERDRFLSRPHSDHTPTTLRPLPKK